MAERQGYLKPLQGLEQGSKKCQVCSECFICTDHWTLKTSWDWCHFLFPFNNWESEAQGGWVSCPRLHSWKWLTGSKHRQSESRGELLITRAVVATSTGHTPPQTHSHRSGEEAERPGEESLFPTLYFAGSTFYFLLSCVFHLLTFRSKCLFK